MSKFTLLFLCMILMSACAVERDSGSAKSPTPPATATALPSHTPSPIPPTATTVPLNTPQSSVSRPPTSVQQAEPQLSTSRPPTAVQQNSSVVEYFGADRMTSSNMIGGSVYVSWRVTGVQSVSVFVFNPDQTVAAIYDNEPAFGGVRYLLGEDIRQYGLPAELTFRLGMPGSGDLDQFTWQVVAPITNAAEAVSFTTEPSSVHPGDTVTLRWEVRGAERIAIAATDPGNFPFQNLSDLPASGSAVVTIPLDIRPTTGWPAAVSFGMWVTQPSDGRMVLGNSSTYVLVIPQEE